MGFHHPFGQALAVHCKSMVHRGDLDFAGFMVFDRMVCTVMAMVHLDGFGPQRDGQHLMA